MRDHKAGISFGRCRARATASAAASPAAPATAPVTTARRPRPAASAAPASAPSAPAKPAAWIRSFTPANLSEQPRPAAGLKTTWTERVTSPPHLPSSPWATRTRPCAPTASARCLPPTAPRRRKTPQEDKKRCPVQIEIWSDVVCPWCYIGKRRLERALGEFEHADEVEVTWRSFQLNPDAPATAVPTLDYLAQRFGPQAQAMTARVAEMGKGEGLNLDFASS